MPAKKLLCLRWKLPTVGAPNQANRWEGHSLLASRNPKAGSSHNLVAPKFACLQTGLTHSSPVANGASTWPSAWASASHPSRGAPTMRRSGAHPCRDNMKRNVCATINVNMSIKRCQTLPTLHCCSFCYFGAPSIVFQLQAV